MTVHGIRLSYIDTLPSDFHILLAVTSPATTSHMFCSASLISSSTTSNTTHLSDGDPALTFTELMLINGSLKRCVAPVILYHELIKSLPFLVVVVLASLILVGLAYLMSVLANRIKEDSDVEDTRPEEEALLAEKQPNLVQCLTSAASSSWIANPAGPDDESASLLVEV